MLVIIIWVLVVIGLTFLFGYKLLFRSNSVAPPSKNESVEEEEEEARKEERVKTKQPKKKKKGNSEPDLSDSEYFFKTLNVVSGRKVIGLSFGETYIACIAEDLARLFFFKTADVFRAAEKPNKEKKKKRKKKAKDPPFVTHDFRGRMTDEYPTAISMKGSKICVSLDCSKKHDIRVFEIEGKNLKKLVTMKPSPPKEVISLHFLPKHEMVVISMTNSDRLMFYSTVTGKLLKELPTGTFRISGLRVSTSEKFLAVSSAVMTDLKVLRFPYRIDSQTDKVVFHTDSSKVVEKCSSFAHKDGKVESFAFSGGSGKRVITYNEGNGFHLWHTERPKYRKNQEIMKKIDFEEEIPDGCSFLEMGKNQSIVAIMGPQKNYMGYFKVVDKGTVEVTKDIEQIGMVKMRRQATVVRLSPNGKILFVGNTAGEVLIFKLK